MWYEGFHIPNPDFGFSVRQKTIITILLPETKYAVFSATKDAVKMENRMH